MIVALVQNNVCVGTPTIDPTQYQTLASMFQIVIDITNLDPQPQYGWVYTGNALSSYPPTWIITKLALRNRFTLAEMTAILSAAQINYTLQAIQGNQAVATFIDLSRSDTQAGVMYLVSLGLITAARANTILTTPPVASEMPLPGSY